MTTRMVPTRREVVDVGHLCDINCLHCYNRFENDKSFRTKENIMQDISTAKNNGNTYIDFTGGEPTLHPDIIEIVEHVISLDMKCCIITNGLQAEPNLITKLIDIVVTNGQTKLEVMPKLIELVDDWLISTHGTEVDHIKIVGFDDARVQQEIFINLLEKHKKTYRFNCCILSYNQYNLAEFAQWAAAKEGLRIVNFINFNPHGVWNNHPEARAQMSDLNIVEDQLNKAIAILEEAGKGINVRYFPMCRIAEENRKYVCNDLQVMHDPYEWSYGTTPKTHEAYIRYAQDISANNELKASPCITCNIRMVCGGINKSFFRMAADRSIVKPILEGSRERDPFFYRRHNDTALVDRNPQNEFCIAVIADDNMRMYVPLFIYALSKNSPDTKFIVFARYTGHSRLREMVDTALGEGVYDSVVVDVSSELVGYPEHSIATATLRFLKFEDRLSQYKCVLWTDVDMLLYSRDILKDHKLWFDHIWFDEQMWIGDASADHALYENGALVPDGPEFRLSGVHFITRGWWERTAEQRALEAAKLEKMVTFSRHYDEIVLAKIVHNSGLPVICKDQVAPNKRHHGIHLGDWRYGNKHDRVSFVDREIEAEIRKLMNDSNFETLLREAASMVPDLRKIEAIWQSTYARTAEKSLLPAFEKQTENDARGSGVSLNKRMKFRQIHYEGSLAIVAMCDVNYVWFAPLFAHSAQSLLEKHPDMRVFIIVRRDPDNAEESSRIQEAISLMPEGHTSVFMWDDSKVQTGGYFTAALRFTESFEEIRQYDYALITDIDIMLMAEEKTILDSHMMHLDRDKTNCFENWISDTREGNPRLPGIHFVTKEWWDVSKDARVKAYEDLQTRTSIEYCHDEYMLGRIVRDSGLSLPPRAPKLWRKHGPHIGDLRLDVNRKTKYMPSLWEFEHIKRLMGDPVFVSIWMEAEKRIGYLEGIRKMWMKLLRR